MKKILLILIVLLSLAGKSIAQSISSNGLTFTPDTLFVNIGDTINFNISNNHNAVEVSENIWNSNGSTSNNGFNIPFGGGTWIVDSIKTYYYVCQPHAAAGMKGIIVSSQIPCIKNMNQTLEGFDPNPIYGTWIWSYDTLSLTNSSNCDVRVRSEFTISHGDSSIGLTDFDLKCFNPYIGNWPAVPYLIDGNGNATGYFGFGGDTSGQVITQGTTQQIIVRIRFRSNANYGTYSASWSLNEVDSVGNLLQNLAIDSTQLSYVDCSSFGIDSSNISSISCFNANDGNASILSIQNGSNNYSYNWSNGDTTNSITNLTAGNYFCIVTDLNWQQCSDSIGITISEPSLLSSTYTQTNVSCFGANDGSAIVNFFGGTIGSIPSDTNYILGWAGTQLPFYLPFPQTVFNTSLLPAPYNSIPVGIYPYSVTDLNGCTIYDTISISQPDSLFSTVISSDITCFGNNDGSINLTINGGTSPFAYFLNGVLQNNLDTLNLSPGNYIDSIVDVNGCFAISTNVISSPTALTTNAIFTNISCFGNCDGEIQAITSGGIAPYNYVWWNFSTDSSISNLCAGNEGYQVFDQNGCGASDDATINEPDIISITLDTASNITTYLGNDGFIEISVNGGTGQLTYNWSNSAGFNQISEDITNLYSGIYYLEVTDSNACNYLDTIELTQPTLWINLDLAINASCFDSCNGAISITANGGDSVYSYLWTGPNNFLSTNDDLVNLCYGQYILTVNDGIQSLTDTFNIFQPQPITSILSVDSIICYNGLAQAQINVWGGTQPFTYSWTNSDTTNFTSILAGAHFVNVVDQNGCFINQTFSLSHPDSIISSSSTTSTDCYLGNNGTANISIISGGAHPFSFSIDNGITFQSSSTFNNLTAGSYIVLALDSNNCQSSIAASVAEPDELITNLVSNDASCFELCDAMVTATSSGGNPLYNYIWSNAQVGQMVDGLCAGSYSVTTEDNKGCIITNTIVINQPAPLIINIVLNGASLVASSGYTSYQWFNADGTIIQGASSEAFIPAAIGEYYVMISDGNCSENSYLFNYTISTTSDLREEIKIYPNPTTGHLNIELDFIYESIKVISPLGKQLLEIQNNSNDNNISKLDLSNFDKGIYLLKIENNNQIMNYRILLQ